VVLPLAVSRSPAASRDSRSGLSPRVFSWLEAARFHCRGTLNKLRLAVLRIKAVTDALPQHWQRMLLPQNGRANESESVSQPHTNDCPKIASVANGIARLRLRGELLCLSRSNPHPC
jgi:hypothetical protein